MRFKEIPLAEIVDVYVDNRGKTCPVVEKENSYKVLIATNCINESLYPEKNKIRYVDKETYENWFRSHPQPNDIIFVNKGTPGGTALVPENIDFCIAQDMVALRIKDDFDFKYVFAALRSDLVKKRIESMHVGTMIPHFKKGDFKLLTLPIPEKIEDQENIGQTHLNILKKIHVNNEIINKLEELAQTLFKRWFVDFEFPNVEGKPYKSSGGKLVESQLGLIPPNFKINEIKELCELKYGKSLTKKNRIPGPYPVYGSGGITGTHEMYLVEGPGLVLGRKGSIGTLYLEQSSFYPIDTVFYIESKKYSILYLYVLFNQLDFTQSNSDSAVPGLNRNTVYNTKLAIPPDVLIKQFEGIIAAIFQKVFENINENKNLSNLRDMLLPKLLSGEIELPDDMEVTDDVPIS